MYRIGIDLGTTNCALAATAAGDGQGHSFVLEIAQREGAETTGFSTTLPSFLYLPPDGGEWTPGRWARDRMREVPGRVIGSAKSWLIHHRADRRARFLPMGGDVAREEQLSPVEASARLLAALREAWDARYPAAPFVEQEIAITVPASFDPAAQQLTLEAAREAGFPEGTLLLEEPQAAFYAWLETPEEAARLEERESAAHVLVVDLGGGTTDFSLFSLEPVPGASPRLSRIAVSNHLLLGGDNLDLALAHDLEKRLERELPPTAFARLLARCREIKEEALSLEPGSDPARRWPVAVPLPGASLLAGTLRAEISAREVERLLLEGFFPDVGAGERPLTGGGGLREVGLPYARDPAVTRHLADFLRGRPRVDFLLCNGGLTKAPAIRARLLENLTRWQEGAAPVLLENTEPDLAVARGAARFLHLRAMGDPSRIEAGASAAYYAGVGEGKAVCVLPLGAQAEVAFTTEHRGLRALVGEPAVFPLYRHPRRPGDAVGDLVRLEEGFLELPPVETRLTLPEGEARVAQLPVHLRTTLRATGLLRVELVAAGGRKLPPWPLEFSLRGETRSTGGGGGMRSGPDLKTAPQILRAEMTGPRKSWEKLTANAILTELEKELGQPRAAWDGVTVRALFDAWLPLAEHRSRSPEHEEAWLQLGGYWLRPGCGMPGDRERLEAFWPTLGNPSAFPRKAVKLQRWIAGRRLAAGLNADRALALWKQAAADWKKALPSAEAALLAGALESLPVPLRDELARRMADAVLARPDQTAFWRAVGRLLSRALFHEGTGQVVPPETVVAIWEKLRRVEVPEPVRGEAAAAWLRAGRLTGLRPLDLPGETRRRMDDLLRRWEISEVRRHPLHEVVPVVVADRSALLGESLPPGLTLREGG